MDNRRTLNTVFIFALFALMFALVVCMLFPFFTVILWTVFLYVLISPLHRKWLRRLDRTKRSFELKRHILAGGFSVGILLVIIGPLSAVCSLLVQQLLAFLHAAEAFFMQNPDFFTTTEIGHFLSYWTEKLSFHLIELDSIDILAETVKFIQQYSSRILAMGTTLISGAGNFIISIIFIVFALYFCFLDGRYLAVLFCEAVPIDPHYMAALMKKFVEITRHLFCGYILVALYQGFVAFLIMVVFRIDGALLFSVVLMFASFIPLFGAALVWFPLGIALCASRSVVAGILFLVLCGICVSFLDNFLRPLFLKDRINVHPLVIFFAILGGIKMFGMNGLLLGPLIIILFFTILDMLVSSDRDPIVALDG
ncbi:MAG: AI-2E family transporter [Treponemataceae bacterium]|nr:AI-2E family transporter [Treponemataceae bacterium]